MSASDEVTGLPGGRQLAALAALVRSDPQAIRDIAGSWAEAATDCEYHTRMVHRAVVEVGQDWTGSSAKAFVGYMGQFDAAGRAAHRSLRNAAQALDRIARTLEEAQVSVEHICENLLNEVTRLRAANPKSASGQLDAQIAALTAEATEAARPKVDQAEQILGQARATLSRELSRLDRTFSALAQPGSHAFGPVAGKPFGWRPVPRRWTPPASQHGGKPLAPQHGGKPLAPQHGGTPQAARVAHLTPPTHAQIPPWVGGHPPPVQVRKWIHEATVALEARGVPAAKLNANDIWIIIKHESDGNPNAINLADSNAAAGDPSKGLMQTTMATFSSYALPGRRDIYNPVDNIIAGVRYAIARYGSLNNVPGVVAIHEGLPYVGY
jgi:WXG100 family type VII secretion target